MWPAYGTFDTIHLPARVVLEVCEYVPLDQLGSLTNCVVHRKVPQHELESCQSKLHPDLLLQDADLATLVLAQQVAADLLLTDDLTLRRAAEALGQVPMGSVGILLRA